MAKSKITQLLKKPFSRCCEPVKDSRSAGKLTVDQLYQALEFSCANNNGSSQVLMLSPEDRETIAQICRKGKMHHAIRDEKCQGEGGVDLFKNQFTLPKGYAVTVLSFVAFGCVN